MPDERTFLTMDDGVRIALNLHLPDEGAAAGPPWPVVFEARPYRKDDVSDASALYRRLCDEGGLAVCRADVRGTGSSGDVAPDEYTPRELQDHLATIAWLADQPWSNGNVGMFGTSYSGFNSLQVAALRPPALKAIIPIYATDRRFTGYAGLFGKSSSRNAFPRYETRHGELLTLCLGPGFEHTSSAPTSYASLS